MRYDFLLLSCDCNTPFVWWKTLFLKMFSFSGVWHDIKSSSIDCFLPSICAHTPLHSLVPPPLPLLAQLSLQPLSPPHQVVATTCCYCHHFNHNHFATTVPTWYNDFLWMENNKKCLGSFLKSQTNTRKQMERNIIFLGQNDLPF